MNDLEIPHNYKGLVKQLKIEVNAFKYEVERHKKLLADERDKYCRLFERKITSVYDLKEELKSSNYRAAHYKKLYEKSLGANNG